MQACPYDALYIDPSTNTAAKCNFCAHRTELGLQPACVVVCPEQAIIAGDIDDPNSRIAQLLGRENVRVRRPDQGTQPKLWYIGAEETAITPEVFPEPQGSIWSDIHDYHAESLINLARKRSSIAPARLAPSSSAPGVDATTPLRPEQTVAAHILAGAAVGQVDYNVAHEQPWGRLVSLYFLTKAVAAGSFLMTLLALGFHFDANHTLFGIIAPLASLILLGMTNILLIADLRRPERFFYILTKPNFSSWLVRGAYILAAFGILTAIWLLASLLRAASLTQTLIWPTALLACVAACYTAFLFAQASGRDFWQSPLLLPHLLSQAFLGGGALLILIAALSGSLDSSLHLLAATILIALAAHTVLLLGEFATPHSNEHIHQAAMVLTRGYLSTPFWWIAIFVGIVLAALFTTVALMGIAPSIAAILAAICVLTGMLVYEDLWVTAGQSVPQS